MNAADAKAGSPTTSWSLVKTRGAAHVARVAADAVADAAQSHALELLERRQLMTGTPYPGPNPASLPGVIEAENFDQGAEGVAYHKPYPIGNTTYRPSGVDLDAINDTQPGAVSNGGFDIASIHGGDWLAYTVNVPAAGTYNLDFRVASAGAGGTFHVEIDGANVTGSLAVPNTGGWTTWQTVTKSNVTLPAGTHLLKVVFDTNGGTGFFGNFNWLRATSAGPTIGSTTSNTALGTSAASSLTGQSVTFTATVTGSGATPGGTVTFKDGTTVLGTGTLSAGGVATLTTSALAVGSHSITASYGGDPTFNTSASSTVTQTVNKGSTGTTLSLAPTPSAFGQSITLTATLAALTGTGTPTGSITFTDGATVLGTTALGAGGQAQLQLSSLAVGNHQVVATYAGDANFAASASAATSHDVNQAGTAVTLTSSANPVAIGAQVTFTASVGLSGAGAGTPTGTVSFYDGSTLLGTSPIVSGKATYATSTLGGGPHSITATYNADANFSTSTSTALAQTVKVLATPSVTVSVPSTAPVFGQSMQISASVAGTGGTATGSVTFMDGTTVLGTANLSAGVATLTLSNLATGGHAITATYAGDSNYNAGGTASSTALTVNKSSTAVTLSSSAASGAAFGASVTFTATVSAVAPGAGSPTGTVSFYDGTTLLGTTSIAGGKATFSTSALTIGGHSITATYNDDANFSPSATASALSQTITQATAAVAVTSNANPAVTGQSVTFTATVTGNGATGSIIFKDGTTVLGTVALSGGSATYTTSTLAAGAHSVTASYSGDANFAPVVSPALSEQVNSPTGLPATQTPYPGPNAANLAGLVEAENFDNGGEGQGFHKQYGTANGTYRPSSVGIESVNDTSAGAASGSGYTIGSVHAGDWLAYSVNVASGGVYNFDYRWTSGGAAGGTFHMEVDGVNVTGSLQVPTTSAWSAYATTSKTGVNLTAGFHLVKIVMDGNGPGGFVGNFNWFRATNATPVAAPTVPTNLLAGSVTASSIVLNWTAPSNGTQTGYSLFRSTTGVAGSFVNTGAVIASAATTYTDTGLASGTTYYYQLVATNTTGSSAASNNASAMTTATASVALAAGSISTVGSAVTFTATVSGAAGTPTGSVTFKEGTTVLGVGTLSGGVASFTTSALAVGSHTVTAVYGGDATYAAATSSAATQTVSQGTVTTTLGTSNASTVAGQSVTFTATIAVATGVGTPSGTVTFKDGTTVLGTTAIVGSVATFSTSVLGVGSHSVTAVYNGDTNFSTSTSTATGQSIAQASTGVTLGSSASTSAFGQGVTLTATLGVTAPGAGTPTGTVTFFDGTTNLGTGTVSAGKATLSIANLAVGGHTLTAVYSGDTSFTTATSAGATQAVNKATTSATLTSSSNPQALGQPLTLTATIAVTGSGAGTPTGTVTFFDGTTNLGTGTIAGGKATLVTSSLTGGGHSITAVYAGDTSFATSTSAALNQTVSQLGTVGVTVSVPATSPVVGQSASITATLSVSTTPTANPAATPTGTVTFYDGATVLGTVSVTGTTATLSLSNLAVGGHSITAQYNGDANFASQATLPPPASLTIAQAATTVTLGSSTGSPNYGTSVTFTATLAVTAPGAGTPTGTVTFFDGTTSLGTVTVSGGKATLATSALTVGGHSITAVYNADANFTASASAILTQTVAQGVSGTTVASNANPAVTGQSITFSATVSAATGTPTGTVTFKDGTTVLGTGTLVAGVATYTTSSLPAGSHAITAVYGGDTTYATSTSTAVTQAVNSPTGLPATQTPFPGPTALTLPGVIEAENFDNGGEGQGYHKQYPITNTTYRTAGVDLDVTSDSQPGAAASGGYDLASVHAGDWVAYQVNVLAAGPYTLDFRVASSGAGGNFHLEVDGVNVTGSLAVPNTGGWTTWATVTKSGVNLPAGLHLFKVVFDSNGGTGFWGNFNWFRATSAAPVTQPGNVSVASATSTSVTLNWSAPSSANQSGYSLYRAAAPGGPFTLVTSALAAGATTYTDTGLASATPYYYYVVATNAGGASPQSNTAAALTAPAAPNALTATPSGSTVTINWTAPTGGGQGGYVLTRRTGTTGNFVQIATPVTSDTSYVDTTAVAGTTYYYTLAATNAAGSSPVVGPVSATTVPSAPLSPAAATQSSTSIALTWAAPASGTQTGYTLLRSTTGAAGSFAAVAGAAALATTPGATSFTDTGLAAGTTYYYQVVANNGSGASAASATASTITAPAAPVALTAVPSSGSVSVTWSAPADASQTGYVLSRRVGNGSFTVLATLAGTATSYNDTGLLAGTSYAYQLVATNAGGSSPLAGPTTVVTVPTPPQTFTATAVTAQAIALSWAAPASGTQTGYSLFRSLTGVAGSFTQLTTLSATTTTFSDGGLSANTNYYYQVVATNAGGASASSTTLALTTLAFTPTGVTATAKGSGVVIAWTPVTGNGNVTYRIERQPAGGSFAAVAGATALASTVSSFTDTGLAVGGYTYRVFAVNGAGSSPASATAAATVALPPTPTQLQASTVTSSKVTLTWTEPAAGYPDGFLVERSLAGSNAWSTVGSVNGLSTGGGSYSLDDATVADGTLYTYRVTAVSTADGNSATVATVTALTPLGAPTNLVATPTQAGPITLTWTNNSVGAAGFNVQRSSDGGATWTTLNSVAVVSASYTDAAAVSGATYSYRVNAINASTSSAFSAAVSTAAFPAAPANLGAVAVAFNRINLTWNGVFGATSYKVERSADGVGGWTAVATGVSGTTFADTTVAKNKTYYYRVEAIGAAGASTASTVAHDTTPQNPPAAPTGVQSGVTVAGRIDLAWAANAEPDVTGYRVYRGLSAGFTVNAASLVGTTATTSFSDTSVDSQVTYYYVITAIDASAEESAASAVTQTTAAPGAPAAPTGLFAGGVPANGTVHLVWTKRSIDETGFSMERYNAATSTWAQIATVGVGVLSYDDAPPTNGVQFYRVRAFNGQGSSAYSNVAEAAAVESPFGGTVPVAPVTIQAEDFDNGGQGLGYNNDVAGNPHGQYRPTAGVDIETTTDAGGGFDVTGMHAGEWLQYTFAVNADGSYSIEPRVAASVAGSFHFEFDNGAIVTPAVTVNPTNGAWVTLAQRVTLTAGTHTMRVVFDTPPTSAGGGVQLNYVKVLAATSTPDVQIKTPAAGSFTGVGVIDTTGANESASQNATGAVSYVVRVANNGPAADTLLVTGTATDANGWRVRYFDSTATDGTQVDITALVTAGGWSTGPLSAGAFHDIRVEVTPTETAAGGSTKDVLVSIRSAFDASNTVIDTVKATTTADVVRGVSLRRHNYDIGGHYLLTVRNTGNVGDSIVLAGPAAGSGWTVKYYDAATGGNDITAAVTAGTYSTGPLAAGATRDIRVEITGASLAAASVTLTATSAADNTKGSTALIKATPTVAPAGGTGFTIGVLLPGASTFSTWKSLGINTLFGYNAQGGTVSVSAWSQAAAALGLKYVRTPSPNAADDLGDPNLLAWMQQSDANALGVDPSVLAGIYAGWKALNPNLPVFADLAGTGNFAGYASAADLLAEDFAPVNGADRADEIDQIGLALDRLLKAGNGKSTYAVIEAGAALTGVGSTALAANATGPTADQVRAEIWEAVVHGARGIVYNPGTGIAPDVQAEIARQNATLSQISAALGGPIDPPILSLTGGASSIESTWRTYGGKSYFVVLNKSGQSLASQALTLAGVPAGATVTVVGENRTLTLNGQTLTDDFGGYGVHVYAISNAAPAVSLSTGPVGVNLDFPTDFSTIAPFTDVAKLFRRWGQSGAAFNADNTLTFTADGVPLQNASALSYLYTYPDGVYHLSYQGSGTVTFSGLGAVVSNRQTVNGVTTADVTITRGTGDFVQINVSNIDPANPITHLHLYAPGYSGKAGEPAFMPTFVQRLQPFQTLRFMDWGSTNNSTTVDWGDRAQPGDFTYTTKGVPYEVMIRLANQLHKDVWVNVPANASDDFLTHMADLFRDQLDPTLKVHVEYGNEVWNPTFQAFFSNLTKAKADPTTFDNSAVNPDNSDFTRAAKEYGIQVKRVSDIWKAEFAAAGAARVGQVSVVLGGQTGTPHWAQVALQFMQNTLGANPATVVSEIAIAPYIGHDLGAANTQSITLDQLFANVTAFTTTTLAQWIADAKALATQYGLQLSSYEGGQDMSNMVNGAIAQAAQLDPRMGQLFQKLIDVWQAAGGGELTLFSDTGTFWGLLPSQASAGAPKWDYTLEKVLEHGDITIDGHVGYDDLVLFGQYYGQSGANVFWQQGDFNHDGAVDYTDFADLLENFGT